MRSCLTSSRFVGRVGELGELALAAREAISGRPTPVLLGSDSGVGKTRLVAELERELSAERSASSRRSRAQRQLADGYHLVDPATTDWADRYRVRAFAEEMDPDAGLREHAALYLDAFGARRLAATRRGLAGADDSDGGAG